MILFLDGNSGTGKTSIGKLIGSYPGYEYIPPYLQFAQDMNIVYPSDFKRYKYSDCLNRVDWWLLVEKERMEYALKKHHFSNIVVDTSMFMVIIDEIVASLLNKQNALEPMLNGFQLLLKDKNHAFYQVCILNAKEETLQQRRKKRNRVAESFQNTHASKLYSAQFSNLTEKIASKNLIKLDTDNNDIHEITKYLIEYTLSNAFKTSLFEEGLNILNDYFDEKNKK